MSEPRCYLCGNRCRKHGVTDTGYVVCERCTGLIRDRHKNAVVAPPLAVRANKAIWRDDA